MKNKLKEKLNLCNVSVAKKKHGNSPEIPIDSFLEALLKEPSTAQVADHLGISRTSLYRIFNKLKIKLAVGVPVNKYCLYICGYKYCNSCSTLLQLSNFGTDRCNRSYDMHDSVCLSCKNKYQQSYRDTPAYGKMYEKHYNLRSFVYKGNAAKYRAAKLKQTPSWANEAEILEFYKNCPEGYHVDHIVPLQGDCVSGLHVKQNLQYLLAKDNLSKGNRYIPL